MKTILIALLTFITTPGFCQVSWFPEGAKWYYEMVAFGAHGLTTMEVTNEDTLIGQDLYKKILSTTVFINFENVLDTFSEFLYVTEEQGRVSGYHPDYGGSFLYDFNAMPGDTLPMLFGGYSPTHFVLDSVGLIEYNGSPRRFQDIRFPDFQDPDVFWELRVVEGIGSISSHLFHLYTIIQPFDFPFYYIRCYEDAESGLINLSGLQVECDYLEGITSVSSPKPGKTTIFPNPGSDFVTVNCDPSEINELRIYDRLGKSRFTKRTDSYNIITLDISTLEPGLFFVCGINKAGQISFTEKILKE